MEKFILEKSSEDPFGDMNNSLQDYMKYSMYHKCNTGSTDMISISTLTIKPVDFPIPMRSPRRLQNSKKMSASLGCLNTPHSPAISVYNSSTSFSDKEYTSDDSDSIFSNCEYHEFSKEKSLDLNLEYSDLEKLLEEFELDEGGNSKIVFAVDEVVTIIGVHNSRELTTI